MKASERRFHRFIRNEMRETNDKNFAKFYNKYFKEVNLTALTKSSFLLMDNYNVKPSSYWDLVQKSLLLNDDSEALKKFLKLPLFLREQIIANLESFTPDGFRVYIDLLTIQKCQRTDLFDAEFQDTFSFLGIKLDYGDQEFSDKIFELCRYQKGLNTRIYYGDAAAFDFLLKIHGEEKVYLATERIESELSQFGIAILYKVLKNYEHFSDEPLSWGLELLNIAGRRNIAV